MPTKIDELLAELFSTREALGHFSSDITTLFKRAEEDRSEREREHRENQTAMGELRQSTAASIAELRRTADARWSGAEAAIAALTVSVNAQSEKLDAADVQALQTQRLLPCGRVNCSDRIAPPAGSRLAVYAGVGVVAIAFLGWAFQMLAEWGVGWLLAHLKFGG